MRWNVEDEDVGGKGTRKNLSIKKMRWDTTYLNENMDGLGSHV